MNIKDTAKILTGKTLDKYNRGIGLAPLSTMNKDQDKILEGIYSQQGNQSITEQSNVIHLENSGNGAVELVSVEGNSMVNNILEPLSNLTNNGTNARNIDIMILKPSTTYTLIVCFKDVAQTPTSPFRIHYRHKDTNVESIINLGERKVYTKGEIVKQKFTSCDDIYRQTHTWILWNSGNVENENMSYEYAMILEGDWTNKEVSSNHIEGIKSCFEEKINEQDKYEVEILLKNKNLIDMPNYKDNNSGGFFIEKWITHLDKPTLLDKNKEYHFKCKFIGKNMVQQPDNPPMHITIRFEVENLDGTIGTKFETMTNGMDAISTPNSEMFMEQVFRDVKKINSIHSISTRFKGEIEFVDFQLSEGSITEYIKPKSNKIKVSINEPLRGLPNGVKDRLCIVDGKLVVERKCGEDVFDGSESGWIYANTQDNSETLLFYIKLQNPVVNVDCLCDRIPSRRYNNDIWDTNCNYEACYVNHMSNFMIRIYRNRLNAQNLAGLNAWLQSNPTKVIYELIEPTYEEVLNEYGEPILLEGYENGTVYIDSAIVPTTTVKYELNIGAYRQVNKLSSDNIDALKSINNDILPKMMDLDFEILMKEMETSTTFTMGREIDMATMQERTYEMLKRLIIGKSLPEQEVKERVVIYLEAGRINEEQAVSLQLVIAETYR